MSAKIFARLLKVDVANRRVTGIIANETLDHSGEIFDYDTSKPHFINWSDSVQKASNGLSLGNVRAQHGSVVAGKLSELSFDDVAKAITVTADIIDDNEMKKVASGCYTGFSIGGKYENKWPDPVLGKNRYTAKPSEVSLVDLPCNADAMFTVVKSDGSEEMRKYLTADATATEVADVAKAAETTDIDALRKALDAAVGIPTLHKYISELLDAAELAQKPVEQSVKKGRLDAIAEALVAKAPKDESVLKALSAARDVTGYTSDTLAKGLWAVQDVCGVMRQLGYTTDDVASEAMFENDGSKVPAMLVDVMKSLGAALVAMVNEEVAELLSAYAGDALKNVPTEDLAKAADPEALAKSIGDLVAKSVEETMTKALGDISVNNAKIVTGFDDMRKRLDESDKLVKAQGETLAKLAAATPAPGGPALFKVSKEDELKKNDGAGNASVAPVLTSGKEDEASTLIKALHAGGGTHLPI